MEVTCATCRKTYDIDHKDPQYQKIKSGKTKYYTCKGCNQSLQNEASNLTGINPNQIDWFNKIR